MFVVVCNYYCNCQLFVCLARYERETPAHTAVGLPRALETRDSRDLMDEVDVYTWYAVRTRSSDEIQILSQCDAWIFFVHLFDSFVDPPGESRILGTST